jgi:V/A-type H+-transporting ATPase subunit F
MADNTTIAAVGDPDLVLPFRAVGLATYPVNSQAEAEATLRQLLKGNWGVILIAEHYASELSELIAEASSRPLPSIVPIPSTGGSLGYAMERLRHTIRKAVGADTFSQE